MMAGGRVLSDRSSPDCALEHQGEDRDAVTDRLRPQSLSEEPGDEGLDVLVVDASHGTAPEVGTHLESKHLPVPACRRRRQPHELLLEDPGPLVEA